MCRQVECKQCNKPTWAGCGAHVEEVLGHIPPAQRCQGHPSRDGEKKSILSWLKR